MAKIRHGSCLCGSVKYELKGEPLTFQICHCVNCRKFSGSAFLSDAFFTSENFTITHGSDVIKSFRDYKTWSGRALIRWFCSNCGSSIYVSGDSYSLKIVSIGTLDDEVDWVLQGEMFREDKLHWVGEM